MVISITIFLVELLIMTSLSFWPIESPILAGLFDSIVLSVLVSAVLYFVVFRPLIRLQENLSRSQASLKAIFANSRDGMLVVDRNGSILFNNSLAKKLLNRPEEEITGQKFGFPVIADSNTKINLTQRDSRKAVVEFHCTPTVWEEQSAMLISLRDVTATEQQVAWLEKQSLMDELTHLNNRRGFFMLAEQQIKLAKRTGTLLIYFIDLDNMKSINDQYGHKNGDQALKDTASLLANTFRESDIIARIGGDEFAVASLVPESQNLEFANQRIEDNVDLHNQSHSRPYRLSLSYGIVQYDIDDDVSLEDLLAQADESMYQNKCAKKRAMSLEVNA